MASVMSAITNTVPITQFNRGLAGKIFDEVKQCGAKVVMKNNTAECVLISPDEYVRLMDELNDARLLAVASERMAHFDPSTLISEEEMNRRLGVTEDDLSGFDEVDENGYGKPLGNHSSTSLAGLMKIKLRSAGLRIVYQLRSTETSMMIIVIGVRADEEVYELAQKRVRKHDILG